MDIISKLRAASMEMPQIYTNNMQDQKRVDSSEQVMDEAADKIEKLAAALREHHQWQCEAEGLTMEYERDGKKETMDITGEYYDSDMYDRTVAALGGD